MHRLVLVGTALFALAACGETIGEQTLAGGTVGAAAAVVTDANPVKGAIVGAAGNLIFCQTNPGRC
ncbi:hypothetical protein ACS3SW_16125 [Roseobacteraceae bacterium S113]